MVDKIVVDKLTTGLKNLNSRFKLLLEKVTLFEERILKIENEQSKEKENVITLDSDVKTHKKRLEDQTKTMNNTYIILENVLIMVLLLKSMYL